MTKLYGIGVGPGDKELLTLKAVKVLGECDVIVAPSAKHKGESIALDIAREFIKDNAKIIIKYFPMGGQEQEEKIEEAFKVIEEELLKGKKVAFLTIGDPFVYSTYIYLLKYIEEKGYETETIPGITSFCASASLAGEPLVIGDEPLLIIPGNRIHDIRDEKFVVVMKVYRNEERIIHELEKRGFNYVYVKKAGREGQMVSRDKEEILKNSEYMSLIIGRRL